MKFGKLEDISNVDFTLPREPYQNKEVLAALNGDRGKLYIGCTGWTMPEWKGSYYPAKTAAKDFLYHYSRQFNTIEFNTTHYNIPKVETVKKWKERSADDFVFCPKIYQYISHTKLLGTDTDRIIRTVDNLSFLEEKLGPMFMQLPPYFDIGRLDILHLFLDNWPNGLPITFELRHASWYESQTNLDRLAELVRSYGQTLLITDVAGRRDLVHMRLTGDILMVRWVGNGLHATDFQRIDEWVERIRYYMKSGVKRVYFFTHEPDNILAPDIAAYLYSKIGDFDYIESRGPSKINGDSQLKLF